MRRWRIALELDHDEPPGIGLCVPDTLDHKPDEIIPHVGHLTGGTLTLSAPPVAETLAELIGYARAVHKSPFLWDIGAGSGVLMETRYEQRSRFGNPVADLLATTCEVYAECLRTALRPGVRANLDTIDVDHLYFDVAARKLSLEPADRDALKHLSLEYRTADSDRKWEIYRHFRKQGWGDPF